MKEYAFENGHKVNIEKLKTPWMSLGEYGRIHKQIIRPCHDIIIQYRGGALLIVRKNYPVKDILWPIGGQIERGVKVEDSLRARVEKECNLDLDKISELGCARTFFETDPVGHGRGTDTINFMYFAKGRGKIKLDSLHSEPTIIKPRQYTQAFKKTLHPYVKDFMDLIMPLIKE